MNVTIAKYVWIWSSTDRSCNVMHIYIYITNTHLLININYILRGVHRISLDRVFITPIPSQTACILHLHTLHTLPTLMCKLALTKWEWSATIFLPCSPPELGRRGCPSTSSAWTPCYQNYSVMTCVEWCSNLCLQ